MEAAGAAGAASSLSNGAGVAIPAPRAVRALGSMLGVGESPQPSQRSPRCIFFPSGVFPCPPIQVGDILVLFVSLWSSSGRLAELGPILDMVQLPSLTHYGLGSGLDWSEM